MYQPQTSPLVRLLAGTVLSVTAWLAAGAALSFLSSTPPGLLNTATAAPPGQGGYGAGARDGTGPRGPGGPGYGENGPGGGSGNMLDDRVFHSEGSPHGDAPPAQRDALTDARTLLDPGFSPTPGTPAPQETIGAYQRALITGGVPDQPTLENLAKHLAPATASSITAATVNELNQTLGVTEQFSNAGIDAAALAARVNQLVQERDGGPCSTC